MNRIRLLSEQVANQIAAGEVVERPASVVKELVENALDAGATRITVEVEAGGRSLIRVTDDGCGMSRDDALLCFERHATSKIQRAEDLTAIATMGFRGEALPSIASVSRLTLTTRECDGGEEATHVIINGGRILEVKAASGPPGTTVEARQLFFNLPARRKFLRSEETERAHIHHYLTVAALAFPGVGFTFTHDRRMVWQLPPLPLTAHTGGPLAALRERLRALHGSELSLLAVEHIATLLPLRDEAADDGGAEDSPTAAPNRRLRVWGLIGAPGVSRATREDQHLFVNRRPVENRTLNFALMEGYHTALMKGRYPVCCLFLEVDPAQVDVNIHPAKREVKFHKDRQVRAHVIEAVRRSLLGFHAGAPKPQPPTPEAAPGSAERAAVAEASQRPPAPAVAVPAGPELPGLEGRLSPRLGVSRAGVAIIVRSEEDRLKPEPQTGPGEDRLKAGLHTVTGSTPGPPPASLPPPGEPVPLLKVPLRMVGVIGRLYVVMESDRGMVLLDQHAAHERVLFEQMLKRLEQGPAPCQRLLLPQTVELSPRDAQFVREQLSVLRRLGVDMNEFGERTFLLDGLPPFVRASSARDFVIELVDELKAAGQDVNTLRLGEETIAKTVCRHAVKAHDPLSGQELETLIENLRACSMPYTCPHGRPTLIELNYRELEKKFGRTQ